jgi:hypothetical protein
MRDSILYARPERPGFIGRCQNRLTFCWLASFLSCTLHFLALISMFLTGTKPIGCHAKVFCGHQHDDAPCTCRVVGAPEDESLRHTVLHAGFLRYGLCWPISGAKLSVRGHQYLLKLLLAVTWPFRWHFVLAVRHPLQFHHVRGFLLLIYTGPPSAQGTRCVLVCIAGTVGQSGRTRTGKVAHVMSILEFAIRNGVPWSNSTLACWHPIATYQPSHSE